MLIVDRTADLRLMIMLMRSRILLLKTAKGVKLRGGWLERTANEQIGWQKRSEVHVHGGSGSGHVICVLIGRLPIRASINRHVRSVRVPTSVTSNRMRIGAICTVREASLMVVRVDRLWKRT